MVGLLGPTVVFTRVILRVDCDKVFGGNFSCALSVFGPIERLRGGAMLPLLEVALELLAGAVVNGKVEDRVLGFS